MSGRLPRLALISLFLLTACTTQSQPEGATPTTVATPPPAELASASPVVTVAAMATVTAEAEATVAVATVAAPTLGNTPTSAPMATATVAVIVNGRAEEGIFFRGRADAPVVMYDYSDFL
jgi:hypothetical protein